MIHGEFELDVAPSTYTRRQLDAFRGAGHRGRGRRTATSTLVDPARASRSATRTCCEQVGLGPLLDGLGDERAVQERRADRQLAAQRPVPGPEAGRPDPTVCGDAGRSTRTASRACRTSARSTSSAAATTACRCYNDLRRAYGLAPKTSFTAITGESTRRFPADPLIDPSDPIDDPNILDFVELRDAAGNAHPARAATRRQEDAVIGRPAHDAGRPAEGDLRRASNRVDAFVGMVAEQHVPGTEFGELQLAIWKKQFQALRDGDRFFYANDPALPLIRQRATASTTGTRSPRSSRATPARRSRRTSSRPARASPRGGGRQASSPPGSTLARPRPEVDAAVGGVACRSRRAPRP